MQLVGMEAVDAHVAEVGGLEREVVAEMRAMARVLPDPASTLRAQCHLARTISLCLRLEEMCR